MSFKRGTPAPRQPDLAKYAEAIAAENKAWIAVKDRLPGSPEFDEGLWQQWQQAVATSDVIRTTASKLDPAAIAGSEAMATRPEASDSN